ncbi:hypothetical protein AOR13_3801 [Alteromonas stellipolaris LMG 21856]|nr:hypothetical protein AOR13_3801 [Alteromonas stellipolaris LMG 21856]
MRNLDNETSALATLEKNSAAEITRKTERRIGVNSRISIIFTFDFEYRKE